MFNNQVKSYSKVMEEQARVRISELVKVCPDIGQKGIREMKKMRYNLGKNAQKQSF